MAAVWKESMLRLWRQTGNESDNSVKIPINTFMENERAVGPVAIFTPYRYYSDCCIGITSLFSH